MILYAISGGCCGQTHQAKNIPKKVYRKKLIFQVTIVAGEPPKRTNILFLDGVQYQEKTRKISTEAQKAYNKVLVGTFPY